MANIKLYDGTKDPSAGKVLKDVLKELANYQSVLINRKPGSLYIPTYNFVKYFEQLSYDPLRDQVSFDRFIDLVDRTREMQDLSSEKIIIIESDLFSAGNWCFGKSRHYNNKDYMIVSTSRIQNELHLFNIFAHELGHMYGAARKGRSNTEEDDLGYHCINDLCVMQQKLTVKESLAYTNQRHKANAQTYCMQCQDELRGYRNF